MKLPRLIISSALCLAWLSTPATAGDLTPEQIEELTKRAEAISKGIDDQFAARNQNASAKFAAAASSRSEAIALYINSYQLVNFEREGLSSSEFRIWKDANEDRIKESNNAASLQAQLHYLALTCRASEAEDVTDVITPLISFADQMSQLKEPPTAHLRGSVYNSVFAQAYDLKPIANDKFEWEVSPYNISGIYEKTILPYLRENQTGSLMGAWDKRIDQETRVAVMKSDHESDKMRRMDREERERAIKQQHKGNAAPKKNGKTEFKNNTLPKLRWGKLKDMFKYIDQVAASQAILAFLQENSKNQLGETFSNEFISLLKTANGEGIPQENPPTETEAGATEETTPTP